VTGELKMAKIDIRNNSDVIITQIVFAEYDGDEEIIELNDNTVVIKDCGGSQAHIYLRDINNLIKALQKAQELWGAPN
jgi:hypothetical protein